MITMPACVAITWGVLWRKGNRRWQPFAAIAAGFAIVLVPFVTWHLLHPSQYLDQMKMYALNQAPSTTGPVGLADRVAAFWNYFNPSFLFLSGDSSLIYGTRYTGVCLLPLLIFVPAGLVPLFSTAGAPSTLLVALCLLASPLAAAVVGEAYRINRALMLLPFVALVAAMGADVLWSAKSPAGRVIVVALLALMPLQFTGFYRDYSGDYRVRSAKWLEYNIGGGLGEIIRRQPAIAAPVYIADNVQWAPYYWQFYLTKHGRPDLQSHTTFVDVQSLDVTGMQAVGLMFCRVADEGRLLAAGMTRVAAIPEPDGEPFFAVLRR